MGFGRWSPSALLTGRRLRHVSRARRDGDGDLAGQCAHLAARHGCGLDAKIAAVVLGGPHCMSCYNKIKRSPCPCPHCREPKVLAFLSAQQEAIADELTARQVRLSLGGSVYDPNDAVGRLLFNVLAMVAEFESDLIRLRTREGMKVAKAKGRLRGKQPKLNPRQEAHLVSLLETGDHSTAELADLFGVGRSTVYRAQQRRRAATRA